MNDIRSKWYYRFLKTIYVISFIVVWSFLFFIIYISNRHFINVTIGSYIDWDEVIFWMFIITPIMLFIWYLVRWIFFYIVDGESSSPLDSLIK
jgi:hypothetical protein